MSTGIKSSILILGLAVLLGLESNADGIYTIDADLNSVFDSYADSQVIPNYHPTLVDTGIALAIGDLLMVDATGLWRISPSDPWTDPDGQSGRFASGLLTSALVGQISSDGPHMITHGNPQPFFYIGSSYSSYVSQAGTLYLGFNDTDYGNNEGTVTATVSVISPNPVPEPTTVVLLGVGVAGLAIPRLLGRRD